MRIIPYTTFRKNMAGIIDEVNASHDIAIITRESSDPAVVMSLEDYNSMIETMHLFSTPKNAKALMEGINECEAMIENKKS
ncbi:MAG TPA: type II toxin-antitoxin system Phd/YefM family antitoxin [Gammaproteobacteria bacterium]|nr:type II toxin-antitoxin system Phd/YefM family antitoxin [Gammaproteobacteria bacterium]